MVRQIRQIHQRVLRWNRQPSVADLVAEVAFSSRPVFQSA
jgi:hypothetical protein